MSDTPHTTALADEIDFPWSYQVEMLVRYAEKMERELYTRPRTEFYAVGWWDGKQVLFEPNETPVRGALLFRPVPQSSMNNSGEGK